MKLDNKRVLITGATSGIGLEMVRALSPSNEILAVSRQGTLPEDLSGRSGIELLHVDLSDRLQLEALADRLTRQHTHLDVLVNNAAVQFVPGYLSDDFNYDGIRTEIDTNFTAICQLTYLMLPLLQMADRGLVVNVNSGLAITPKRSSAIYCATKSALDSFSVSLGYQLENTTVDVHQAFLPLVDTGMTRGRGAAKLLPAHVADKIIAGMEAGRPSNDVGKVKLLRLIHRVMPGVARSLMRGS